MRARLVYRPTSMKAFASLASGLSLWLFAFAASAQITGRGGDEKLEPVAAARPLVLPHLGFEGRGDLSLSHVEGHSLDGQTGVVLEATAAGGVLGDIEIELTVLSIAFGQVLVTPLSEEELQGPADWGMSRLGGTLRFVATDEAELAARFRFLVDNDPTIGLNGSMPVRLHGGRVFRFDTGVSVVGRVPTARDLSPSFGIADVGSMPLAPEAGVPIRMLFQPAEDFFFGLNSGFGIVDVTDDDSIFLPLGAQLGGTLVLGQKLIMDLKGAFLFPTFGQPTFPSMEGRVHSELWQLGFSADVSLGL